jgi:hypothetical protein
MGTLTPAAAGAKYVGGGSLSASYSSVPGPAAPASPNLSKLDQVRGAVDTIVSRDILPVLAAMRMELLSSKVDEARGNQLAARVKALRPDCTALAAACVINVKIPKPSFKADDDRLKQLRLTLLYHIKEMETVLEQSKACSAKADAPLMAKIATLVKQIKAAATAAD